MPCDLILIIKRYPKRGKGWTQHVGLLIRLRTPLFHLLLCLELLSDWIWNNFSPIDFRACYRQLSSQCLECRIRHCLVVFWYCHLVILFTIFDYPYDFLGCLDFICNNYRFAALFRRYQLNVTIFIVMNLQLKVIN